MDHLRLWEDELAPGETVDRPLGFSGCPLAEDWWVVVWMEGGPVDVNFEHEGALLRAWAHNGTGVQHVQLPAPGFPDLRIRNAGQEPVSFRLYFDQTCDCTAKGVSANGPVWLNADAVAGQDVTFDLRVWPFWPLVGDGPETPGLVRVRASHVTPTTDGPVVHATEESSFRPRQDATCDEELDGFVGCMQVAFTARADGTQYVYVEVLEGVGDGWMVQILPTIDVAEQTPLAAWLPWAALGLATAVRQTLSHRGAGPA